MLSKPIAKRKYSIREAYTPDKPKMSVYFLSREIEYADGEVSSKVVANFWNDENEANRICDELNQIYNRKKEVTNA